MALPERYTEESLAEFMHQEVRDLAGAVNWSTANNSYTEVINDVLLALDATALDGFTGAEDLTTLRAVARREVWRAILKPLAARYNFRSNLQDFQRKQMYDAAALEYQKAVATCEALGIETPGLSQQNAVLIPVVHIQDPYGPIPMDDATVRVYP
jgi:hypothetical protein